MNTTLKKQKILALTGSSGAGKGTVVNFLQKYVFPNHVRLLVSCTTRVPREKEIDGVHYHFVTKQEFQERVGKGEFIEWVEFDTNYYGTLLSELYGNEDGLNKKGFLDIPILETELEGLLSVRSADFDGLYIYLAVEDLDVLKQRLIKRGTQTEESINNRIKIAAEQMARAKEEQLVWIVNEKIIDTMELIVSQIEANFEVKAELGWREKIVNECQFT